MPYLKEADDEHLSRDHMGQRLIYAEKYITCDNSSYQVCNNEDGSVVDTLSISQNADVVDIEDRIIKLKTYIKNMQL